MKLEILIPVVLALLSLITFFACKFNKAYLKNIKYFVWLLLALIIISSVFFYGASAMYLTIIKTERIIPELIYSNFQNGYYTICITLLIIMVYTIAIGSLCKKTKELEKQK